MNIFKVEIKGDKILVHAKATPYDPGRKPRVREGSRSAAKYLKKLGHTFEKCLNPKQELNNSDPDKCSVTWIFEKKIKPVTVAKTTKKRKTTKKTSPKAKKVVDKSSENVILNKEEKTEPKETSK